jgi:hypothetical protein
MIATLTLSSDRHLNALCRIYVGQVGNQLLQSFPTKQPVLGLAEVDFSLVENPLFTASSLSFFCKGEVYSLANPVVRPLALLPPFRSLPSHWRLRRVSCVSCVSCCWHVFVRVLCVRWCVSCA